MPAGDGPLIAPEKLLRPALKRMKPGEKLEFFANIRVRRGALWSKARALEVLALKSGERFRCRALSGDSGYNIAINADMSVSCNCDDIHGEGRLGSLNDASLSETLRGPRAMQLRHALADGKLPIRQCAVCPELERVSVSEAQRATREFSDPTAGVMLETNANCNLSCIACYRAVRPLDRLKMRIEEVRRVGQELSAMGVKQVAFFTLGEPFMANSILDEIRVLKQEHPALRIFTSTNGVLVDSDAKRQAALAMDHVIFSIDGCDQETAQRYQVGTDFAAAYENMCALVRERDQSGAEDGPIIEWKYVVFRWNDRARHIERALRLAREAKVDGISFWHTLNPVHGVSTRFFSAAHFRAMEQHHKIRFVPLARRGQGLYEGR